MYDVLQIIWWLTEAILLGYLCNYKFFENDTDRLLFAPVAGFACVLIFGNMLWMWSVSTHLMTYIFVVTLVFAAIFLIHGRPRPNIAVALWLVGGAFLVAAHGSLIPFAEKLFQAFPLDRFHYLSAAIFFEKENISYFDEVMKRLSFNGDKRAFMLHPMMPSVFISLRGRPAPEIAFIIFSWATPRELYRLANAWEVFIRVLQFCSLLALFWKALQMRFLSGFLALAVVFGYWFQYAKDFNAWGSITLLPLAIGIIALIVLILNNGRVDPRNRYYAYFLALAVVIGYPDLGLPFCLGFFVLICANEILRNGILLRKWVALEAAVFAVAVFVVYPSILAWLKIQFEITPYMIGGEEPQGRGIYRLFAEHSDRLEFVNTIIAAPVRLIADPVAVSDMIIGSFGFPYVSYLGSTATLFGALLIAGGLIAGCVATTRPPIKLGALLALVAFYTLLFIVLGPFHSGNHSKFDQPASLVLGALILVLIAWSAVKTTRPDLRILLVLVSFYAVFFAFFLISGKVGGAYRSLPSWGAFASSTLLILLAASELKMLRGLAVAVGCAHLVFGASIFYMTNTRGMESFPAFYPNATGVRHWVESNTIRDKYDFDYRSMIPQLKLCRAVYVDLPKNVSSELRAPRFHAVNLILFLENNDIPYYMAMPNRSAGPLIGDAFFPGFSRAEVNADCVVEEEIRDGRISYKFVQAKWY